MVHVKKIWILIALIAIPFFTKAQFEKVESAFIYNFTKLMEWPLELRSGDFIIGVLNGPEMVNALNSMVSGKLVGSQNISVVIFNSPNEITNCHIVYIPSKMVSDLKSVNEKLSGKSTVVISFGSGLITQGADFSFIQVGDKLSFEMSKSSINKKNITVSSRLEQLAAKVY